MKKLHLRVIMVGLIISIWGILVLLGIGCDITNEEAEAIMPAGYKILCSMEGGKYTVKSPLYERLNVNVFDTRRAAAEHAVWWHDYATGKLPKVIHESDNYTWGDCK